MTADLDLDSPVPLYAQLADVLRQQIRTGGLRDRRTAVAVVVHGAVQIAATPSITRLRPTGENRVCDLLDVGVGYRLPVSGDPRRHFVGRPDLARGQVGDRPWEGRLPSDLIGALTAGAVESDADLKGSHEPRL